MLHMCLCLCLSVFVSMKNIIIDFRSTPLIFRGTPPETDLVVVIDGSGSIGKCEFDVGIQATTEMLNQLSGKSDTKYATVLYSTLATVKFSFLPADQAGVQLAQIAYPAGGTNTQAGLDEAAKLFKGAGPAL